jgi:DNA modification methylase
MASDLGTLLGRVHNSTALSLLQRIPTASVGAVVTDPPFFISTGRSGGGEFDDPWTHVSTVDEALSEVAPVVIEIHRVLRPGGALVVMGQGICTTVWDLNCRRSGLDWMAQIAVLWNTGKPRSRNFGSLHTHVSWYSKPGAKHTFNSGERRAIYSNVVVVPKVPNNLRRHPAEKPVQLTNFLVSLLTDTGDLVVDPFCGSGSTLVSAAICERPWIGSDLNPTYCSEATARARAAEFEEVGPLYLWVNGRLEEV